MAQLQIHRWGHVQNDEKGIHLSFAWSIHLLLHKNNLVPKNDAPISFLNMRKFFKYFARRPTFHSPHDFRRRHGRWGRYKNMNMILTHDSTQYLNLEIFTRLTNKITNSFCKRSLQNMISILGHPNKMIFNLVLGMAACPVFNTKQYKATASLKLPA